LGRLLEASLRAGDFHHADEHSDHGEITTTEGAEVIVIGAVEHYLPAAAAPADKPRRFSDR
jgi:hypothetical protein